MRGNSIGGSIVALITPFKNAEVDEFCFQSLVEWHIEKGTNGIVPVGTTGESSTLTHKEHERIVSLAVEAAAGRIPIIAGAGSNSTSEALSFVKHAELAGSDAALVVSPYYNRPTQMGLYQHFKELHDQTNIPIIIYNIPSRCAIDIEPETMLQLSLLPRIIGVKDATGKIERVSMQRRMCGHNFLQLSGEDATALAFNAHGGHGCISVSSNIAPYECSQFQQLTLTGNFSEALAIQDRLYHLHSSLFIESNPCPVKYALSLMGKCTPEVRLPLVELSDANKKIIEHALEEAGIIA